MSFNDVAKEVLKRSIRSAVCIDDEFAPAYSSAEKLDHETPKKLYDSFRRDGLCDLDIYHFHSISDSWHPEYMLNSKDLLILDWELDGKRHDSAVEILQQVVSSNKIPLAIIYTATEDLNSVAKTLISSFAPFTVENAQLTFEEIEKQFGYITEDSATFDLEQTFESLLDLSFEYIYQPSQRDQIFNKIISALIENLSIAEKQHANVPDKLIAIIKNKLKAAEGEEIKTFCHLVCAINEEFQVQSLYRIKLDNLSFRIGSTTVLIFKKEGLEDGIKPEELFAAFSEVLITDPHNFLTLLSLEIRDNIREKFSDIGGEFSQVDEKAFFHQMNNYQLDDGSFDEKHINDFLLSTWTSELYHQLINDELKLIPYLKEFYDGVKDKLTLDDHLLNELVKYCEFVSNTKIKNRNNSPLRFGDTFSCEEQKEIFFLCITPHCDLVNPKDKLNNNFYFIKGKREYDLMKALQNVDSDNYHCSFAWFNDKVIAINWICKPLSFYIENNDIDTLKINYSGRDYDLKHIALVKENFSQRIANKSFGYGYRVGIDIPYISTNLTDESKLSSDSTD